MARAKYKLDTLIEFQDNGESRRQKVDGILVTAEGFRYRTEEREYVTEDQITGAYRPAVARTSKPKARVSTKSKKQKSSETTGANAN